jgi:hypothetical protein
MNGRVPIVIRYIHSAAIAAECFPGLHECIIHKLRKVHCGYSRKTQLNLRRAARGLEAPDPTRASNLAEVPSTIDPGQGSKRKSWLEGKDSCDIFVS